MVDNGKKILDLRKKKDRSQTDLVTKIGASREAIGKYEREEVQPSVGFLLGESEDRELLKDPTMLRRLNEAAKFPEEDKNCILYTLDAMINNVKLKGLNVN